MPLLKKKKETTCTKIEDKVLDYDHYGDGFAFTLPNGKEKYGSWIGFTITMLLNILILVYAVQKGQKVFGYGDSAVNYSR